MIPSVTPAGDSKKKGEQISAKGRRQRSGRLALREYRATREGLLKEGRKPNKREKKVFERKERAA